MASIPSWLEKSYSDKHLHTVLTTLMTRERLRENARTASRRRADPSRLNRLAHPSASMQSKGPHSDQYAVTVGFRPENQRSNRYLDIEPYDRTRVVIDADNSGKLDPGLNGTRSEGRYLNASWVRELSGGKWWIATQAPLPNTAHAFLSVVMQPLSRPPSDMAPAPGHAISRVRTVVQLTPNFESGRQKAHVYFPASIGESWILQPEPGCDVAALKVTLLESKCTDEAQCVESLISLTPVSGASPIASDTVLFRHFLYVAWPDHGIPEPEHRPSLIAFLRLVDEKNKVPLPTAGSTHGDPDPPIMVGCSAGIGRTGSFIALSSLLRAHDLMSPSSRPRLDTPSPSWPPLPPSPLGPLPHDLKGDLVAEEVDSLREQRPGMVQREEQILLVYELLAECFVQQT